MRDVEQRFGGRPLEDLILENYERLGSLEAVGEVLGVSGNTLYWWLPKLDIQRRVQLVKRNPGE